MRSEEPRSPNFEDYVAGEKTPETAKLCHVAQSPITPNALPEDRKNEMRRAAEWVILYSLIAIHLIPIWAVRYFPSQDGAAHVAGAKMALDYLRANPSPTYDAIHRYHAFNELPVPNWVGHAVMIGLMTGVPPIAAEKLLLSLYVVLLPLSIRYAARGLRPGAGPLAIVVFPFLYSYPFQMGFYSFCISLAVGFFTVGYWLRHRDTLTPPCVLILAALSVLLFFSHLFSLVLAYAMLGALALLVPARVGGRFVRRERLTGVLLAGLPVMALTFACCVWPKIAAKVSRINAPVTPLAVANLGAAPQSSPTPVGAPLLSTIRARTIIGHGGAELPISYVVLYGLLAATISVLAGNLRRRDVSAGDLPLLFAAALGGLSLVDWDSERWHGLRGLFIADRFELYAFLLLALWFATQTPPRGMRLAIQGAAAAVAITLAVGHLVTYTALNRQLAVYLSVGDRIEPGSTILPISRVNFGRDAGGTPLSRRIAAFGNGGVGSYLAVQRGAVNFGNYEPHEPHFPLLYRAAVDPQIEIYLHGLDFGTYARRTGGQVDYVLLWGFTSPPTGVDAFIRRQLDEGYEKVTTSPDGMAELFRRKQ